MSWLIPALPLLSLLLHVTFGRTFKSTFVLDIYNNHTPGQLYEVQERSFKFSAGGTINVSLTCNNMSIVPSITATLLGDNPFNIFLCNETPKTNWLYLYPTWGMCYEGDFLYHHCSVARLITSNSSATWIFSKSISSPEHVVARVRACPLYKNFVDKKTESVAVFHKYVVSSFRCEYTGIFLNPTTRLSEDEVWNPFVYAILMVFYGALVAKAVFEIVRYWKYRVNCSFYMYALLFFKFAYVLAAIWYYHNMATDPDLTRDQQDITFVMAMLLAAKFAAHYLTLFVLATGYCIYNTELLCSNKFYRWFGLTLFMVFFYLFVRQDSYMEVPLVVILSAVYSAVLALFWAFHFKRLMAVRYAFSTRSDRAEHKIARQQISSKEVLVGLAFLEIILLLAFIITFEFYHSENYPVPGTGGVLAIEIFDFLLIAPLTVTYNMKDLSRYYPPPNPPPVIHVIKIPGEDYRISMKEGKEAKEFDSSFEQCNELEIQLMRLPSSSSISTIRAGAGDSTSLHTIT